MTQNALLNAPPDSIEFGHNQTMFYFGAEPGRLGERENGAVFGVVTLAAAHSHYTRFRVYRGRVGSGYVQLDDRALTAEEIAYFEALVRAER